MTQHLINNEDIKSKDLYSIKGINLTRFYFNKPVIFIRDLSTVSLEPLLMLLHLQIFPSTFGAVIFANSKNNNLFIEKNP